MRHHATYRRGCTLDVAMELESINTGIDTVYAQRSHVLASPMRESGYCLVRTSKPNNRVRSDLAEERYLY